jgi:hypothetical protein
MPTRHSQAPERDQQRHPLMATFRVMSEAFVLAVGHDELAYFTIPVLFSLVFLHNLHCIYLLKFTITFIAYFRHN